jgi:hypothetical protein
MNFGIARPLMTQTIVPFPLTVPGAGQAVPISATLDKSKLITSFVISNPIAGSSVYLGNSPGTSNVGATQGLEIQPGTAPNFRVSQEGRQLYELQVLSGLIAKLINCQTPDMEKIPFKVWDLTTLYLFSGNVAGSQVTIAAFPEPYL